MHMHMSRGLDGDSSSSVGRDLSEGPIRRGNLFLHTHAGKFSLMPSDARLAVPKALPDPKNRLTGPDLLSLRGYSPLSWMRGMAVWVGGRNFWEI